MNVVPYLQSQSDLLALYKQEMRDSQATRWQTKEYYNAINRALQAQAMRGAWVPYIYTISGGFLVGTYEYTIPWYIREPLDVQQKITVVQNEDGYPIYVNSSTVQTWVDVPAYEIEPDGSGGQKLRLGVNPWPNEARIIWWAENSRLPQAVPTLNADITSSTTSLVISSKPSIGPAGYVKVDDEWIGYADYDVSTTTTTLNNLMRGLNGTAAASHTAGASVAWGVAAMREDLYFQLANQVYANLHNLFLTNSAPQETQNHIFQVRFYQQMADEYWNRFTPTRTAKMRLTPRGMGMIR